MYRKLVGSTDIITKFNLSICYRARMSLGFLIRKTLSGVFLPNVYSYRPTGFVTANCRNISFSNVLKSSSQPQPESEESETPVEVNSKKVQKIPVETSIKYLQSTAYKTTYGTYPVWKFYRRNHKGGFPPRRTRKTCIRKGEISTGSPCPICRDKYLVLAPENVELLKQFISPYSGEILSYSVTGICQKRYKELLISIEIARDQGLIIYDVPIREYNYSDYIKKKINN